MTTALHGFPFLTATSGPSTHGYVSAFERACIIMESYSSRNQEHNLKKEGAIQLLKCCYFSFLVRCLLPLYAFFQPKAFDFVAATV